ncbi:LOW QUALITY PROTEIN: predicted protein, partial [Streptomyces sp. C]
REARVTRPEPPPGRAWRDDLYRDPYPLYARARRSKGLTYLPAFDAWLVARDRDVREVLLRAEDFSSVNSLTPDVALPDAVLAVLAGGFGPRPTVVSSDGAAHRRHRAPLNRGLSAARVAALLPHARACARELVDGLPAYGPVELVGAYARQLPGQVVGRLIGLDPADVPAAVHGGFRAEELLFRPLSPQEQVAAAEDVVALQRLLDGYVRARRERPRDDLCSAMVAALAPGVGELTVEQRHELGGEPAEPADRRIPHHQCAHRHRPDAPALRPAAVADAPRRPGSGAGGGGGGRTPRRGRAGLPAQDHPPGDAGRNQAAGRGDGAGGVRVGQPRRNGATSAPTRS